MKKTDGFKTGVNLGGWLSQFAKLDHQHFSTFIIEQDIKQIANWGMDHVRIPIDYSIIENDEKPYIYQESGFVYIDRCLDWCQANGLNVVLDLHRAPGYSFDASVGANSLFSNPELQRRLIALWEALFNRYAGRKQPRIIFELLNEIALPSNKPWNHLSHQIHKAIRAINNESWIMVGGNEWNSINTLQEIDLFNDPNVFYTFHFYEPLLFTHQKAYWTEDLRLFDKELIYPGPIDDLEAYLNQHPQFRKRLDRYLGIYMDEKYLRNDFHPAIKFIKQTDKPLYCGEFGVIDRAPRISCLNWYRDVVKLLRENNIGYACWSYKQMDFGLVDQGGHLIDEELINIICR